MFSESYCNYQSEGRGTNLQFFGNWNFSIYQREEGRKVDTVGGEVVEEKRVEKGDCEGWWRRRSGERR